MVLRCAHQAGLAGGARYNRKVPCKEGDGVGGEGDTTIDTTIKFLVRREMGQGEKEIPQQRQT